jgi:hypothetical protein
LFPTQAAHVWQTENSCTASWNAVLRAEIVPDQRSTCLVNGKLTHSFLECRTESRNCSRCEPSLCDRSGTAHTKWKRHHQVETEHISDLMLLHIGNFTLQRIPMHTHKLPERSRKSKHHKRKRVVNRLKTAPVNRFCRATKKKKAN